MQSRSQQYGLMLRSKQRYMILWHSDGGSMPPCLLRWLRETTWEFQTREPDVTLANVNGEQRSEFCCNLLALICELCRGAADTTPPQRHLFCAACCMNSKPLYFYHFLELKATPCSSVWCNIFIDFWRSVRTLWPKALHLRCCTGLFSRGSASRNLFSWGWIHLLICFS